MEFSSLFERFEQVVVKLQFGASARIEFYEALSILLEGNQVLLIDALRELYSIASDQNRKPRNPRAIVIHDCMQRLSEGQSLSDALSTWVPYQETSLIAAGEQSGKLRRAFEDAIRVITAKQQIQAAVLSATVYPILLFGMAGLLLVIVSTKLVPKLEKLTNPATWQGAAAALYELSQFVLHYGIVSTVILAAAIVLVLLSLPRMRGPVRIWLDKIPPWSIYRTLHGSTFLLNVAVMLQSGIRLQDALGLLGEHANPWLKERIDAALYGTGTGGNLGVALDEAGHEFPDKRAIQFLRVLASRDGFEEAIARFGNRWLDQSIKRIQATAKLSFGIGIGLVGALLILILAGTSGIQDAILSGVK